MLSELVKKGIEHAARDTLKTFGPTVAIDCCEEYLPKLLEDLRRDGMADVAVEIEQNEQEARQIIAGVLGLM